MQSVNDSRRAWRNFFDSVTGKRRGRKVGRPRFKSRKDQRQSFRLTRNGFSLKVNGRLFLAKVGEVKVRWSRELSSAPSSVTIIREPDGHFYASFVVEVPPSPLPEVVREVGLMSVSPDLPRSPPATANESTSRIRSIWVPSYANCGGWSGRSPAGRKDQTTGTRPGARSRSRTTR